MASEPGFPRHRIGIIEERFQVLHRDSGEACNVLVSQVELRRQRLDDRTEALIVADLCSHSQLPGKRGDAQNLIL